MKIIVRYFCQSLVMVVLLLTLMMTSSCRTVGKKVFEIDFNKKNNTANYHVNTILKKEKDAVFTEDSWLEVFSFDGNETKKFTIKKPEDIREIKARLDALKLKKVKKLPEEGVRPSFFGFRILNKYTTKYGEWATDYAFLNGYLITWDNVVYTCDYSFDRLMEGITADSITTSAGASDFPCANWLFKTEEGFRGEYLSEAPEKEKEERISVTTFSVYRQSLFEKDNDAFVRVYFRAGDTPEETSDWLELTDNPLQVNIDGCWLTVPEHSRTRSFYDRISAGISLNFGENEEREFSYDWMITDRYGNLPPGTYRLDLFRDTGLYITIVVTDDGYIRAVN